jgi:GxxExxY protein
MYTDKENNFLFKDLTYKTIGLAMEIHTELGYGFLEKVYENALMVQFRNNGIKATQQEPIKVYFKGEIVGDYIADILLDGKIILELKSIDKLTNIHKAKAINYLKATGLKVALLINFGKSKLEYERIIYG